jgi:hypothetical protein
VRWFIGIPVWFDEIIDIRREAPGPSGNRHRLWQHLMKGIKVENGPKAAFF